jgi:hypothetical protein
VTDRTRVPTRLKLLVKSSKDLLHQSVPLCGRTVCSPTSRQDGRLLRRFVLRVAGPRARTHTNLIVINHDWAIQELFFPSPSSNFSNLQGIRGSIYHWAKNDLYWRLKGICAGGRNTRQQSCAAQMAILLASARPPPLNHNAGGRHKHKPATNPSPVIKSQVAHFFAQSRDATRLPWFEPVVSPSREASSTTTPHTLMQFWFYSYYTTPSVNRFFEALNGFKLKTCQLQIFITLWDLQLSCWVFFHLSSFTKFEFQIWISLTIWFQIKNL